MVINKASEGIEFECRLQWGNSELEVQKYIKVLSAMKKFRSSRPFSRISTRVAKSKF